MNKTTLVRGCIQAVHCSGRKEFNDIFGTTDGPYLFEKYTDFYNRREDDFICYLDDPNLSKLIAYVESRPDNYR